MATLEIGPLSTFLEEEEIASIASALEEGGWPKLEESDEDAALIEGRLDEDLLADFMDQLEANEAGCDVYLPVEFEEVFEASGYRVGSCHALLLALANMRDDMGIDEDEEAEAYEEEEFEDVDEDEEVGFLDDERSAVDIKDEHMRHLWRAFHKGANAAIGRSLVLRVQS